MYVKEYHSLHVRCRYTSVREREKNKITESESERESTERRSIACQETLVSLSLSLLPKQLHDSTRAPEFASISLDRDDRIRQRRIHEEGRKLEEREGSGRSSP